MTYLAKEAFLAVVRDTPLVSIDLIVENQQGQVLLGLRTNQPAQGYWFVPGGRIQKDESLNDAFVRLAKEELGLDILRNQADFKGVYEHFYAENFAENPDISTHYVVLAYKIIISNALFVTPLVQHSHYQWREPLEIVSDKSVHQNTRVYFE